MNIILKINNASETVQSINLNTNLKQAVRVQAQNDVNYQLIDQNTGYAPENITTKRVGNDLQIAFEGSDIEQPDLIIENYYDQDNSNLLVGAHENGNLYPYVPETGVQTDAVTLLAQEVSVGQALGGEALKSAMWAFNPWWLLALVPIAGIAIAASHDSSSGSKDTTPPGAPTVTANVGGSVDVVPPSDADTKKVTIRYTDENGVEHTSTVEKSNNGKWTSTDANLIVDENTGKTTIPADKVKDNTKVTADAADNSGNKGAEGDAISGIDQVEGKPGITIPEAQDGYINGKELEDGVQTQITLPKGTIEGATVTVTITKPDGTTEQISHTVTGDEVTNGKIDLTIPKESLPADGNYKVDVSIQQGNNPAVSGDTESFELDTGIPGDVDNNGEAGNGDTDNNTKDGAPIVTITDGNGDDYINAKELEDGIQTNVTIPTGTKAGDTITVSVTDPNGKTVEVPHTVTEDDIKNGSAEITIPKDNVPTDGDYTITAKVTDPAGNTSATSEPKKVTVDTGVPGDVDNNGEANNGDTDNNTKDGAPIVTITDGNGDDYINAKELEDGIQTNVTIPTGTKAGDTITVSVTDPNGKTVEIPHTVTEDDIKNGSVDITIPKDNVPTDGDYTITAKVTDPAGNTSATSEPKKVIVDTGIPGDVDNNGEAGNGDTDNNTKDGAPIVTITDGNGDDYINAKELEDGIQTNVTIPTGTKAGDTITVSVTDPNDKTVEVSHTVTEDDIKNGSAEITIPKDNVPTDGDYTITAKVTDPAGNTSATSEPKKVTVDTGIPGDVDNNGEASNGDTDNNTKDGAPIVTITDGNGDDYINAKELEDGIQTNVTIPTGTKAGDTITVSVTDPNGKTVEIPHTVTEDDIKNGSVDITIPKDNVPTDGDYTITAKVTDPAGNTSATSEPKKVTVDTGIPGDVNNNGEANNGDTDDNTKDGAPIVTITDGNGDDYINAKELEDGIQTNVTIPTGTKAGDTITVSVTDPNGKTVEVPHTVTEDDIKNGSAEITIPKDNVPTDGDYTITAKVTDPAGNTSATSEPKKVTVDTGVPGDVDNNGEANNGDTDNNTKDGAPIVTITDGNGDDYINAKELEDGIQTNVTIPTGTKAGDTITVSVTDPNGKTVEIPHTVTEDDIKNGSVDITIPKDNVPTDGDYTITAKVTDPAGNTSATSEPKKVTVDTGIPGDVDNNGEASNGDTDSNTKDGAPIVTITDGNGDEYINAKELEDGVTTKVTIPANTEVGDEITLTVTDPEGNKSEVTHKVTKDDIDNGSAEVTIPKDNVPSEGDYTVTAKVTDPAGNSSAESTPAGFTVDKTAPAAPTVTANDDGSMTITPPADKDTKTVEITYTDEDGKEHPATLTKGDDGKWKSDNPDVVVNEDTGVATIDKNKVQDGSDVTAKAKDNAGNTSDESKDSAKDDVENPPSIAIAEAEDGYVNAKELSDNVQSVVTLPEGTEADAVVTVTITLKDGAPSQVTHTVTAEEATAGKVNLDLPKEDFGTNGEYTVGVAIQPAGSTSSVKGNNVNFTVDKGIPGDVDNNGEANNGDTDSNTKDGAPIVTITDGNGDEYINAKELEDGVTTKVTIPANTEVGDEITLTVTDPNGKTSEVTHKVTKDDIDNGSAEVTIPKDNVPSEGDYTVTAKVTDPAGNSSAESTPAGFTVDKTAPAAPTVTANDDGSMTITPPADKDTKTVEITYTDENGDEHPATLTKGDDGKWKSDNPDVVVNEDTGVATIAKDKVKDGSTVTAKAKDNAGNTGDDASAEAKPNSDDLSGKPELTIAEADDGKVTATELNDGIQTEVKLQTNSKAGDVVTLTITNPDNTTKTIEHTVTEDEATAGKVAVTIPKENVTTDGSYSVSVSQSRDGNATEGNKETFTVDARVPGDTDGDGETDDAGKPVVHIEDHDDEIINASELNSEGKATATITFPENAGYSVGDTLTVTYPDGKTEDIVLTEDNIKDGVKVTFTPLAAGESNEVKAIVKDPQGNSSKEGIDTAKTEEAEVPPTKIVVEVKDDFTDEYKGAKTRSEGTEANDLLSGNGGLGKYEGVVGANGKTIDASDATKLQAIKTLADGLTNDATPTVTFTLDNKITSAQNMVIYRETVTKDGDVFNKEVLTNKFTVSADGKTYSFTDALPETFGTQYRYTAEVQNKATNAVELTTRQDIYLDTQVESMEVTAMANNKDGNLTSITFSITDRSEVGAVVKISYPNTAGTTSTTTAEINEDGTYTVNFADNFNRYSTDGMQVTVIDSAGNIASTKTMYIRNLFSNMNTEMGPDPSQGRKFNVGLITDIINRQATNENGLKFTDDNDHLVVGLDEYARSSGVNGNMASMVGGGELNVDTGAGDDHIQLRGNLQSWRGGSLKMGEGNDKLTFDTAEIATGGQYNIDFGNGNDRLVINGAVNTQTTMNVSFGEGNDSMYVKSNLDGSGSGRYDFGNGDNSLEVGGYVTKSQTFLFGNGSDSFVVAGHVDYATVSMGAGNDVFKVGSNLRYGANVNMGEGDDVLVAGGINNALDAQTVTVDMAEGNDTATFTSINGGKVDMGTGDDVLNISTLSGGTINLGAGDDIVNFSDRVTGGTVDGGEGNDIAVLKEVGHSYEMSNFKNVEIFDLTADGRQDINIRLSDLQQDGDTLAKVYIRGTSLDTVDLGNNNNYDDTAQNLKDTSKGIAGSNVGTWAKGAEETVDGVTYDVYSYTSGNTGTITTELVYIEQGIQVI